MSDRPICPICEKRRPERFCPAKGEKICSVCCGTEREVTLDCPPDCPYLISAHRYEQEHRKPLAENEMPFPKVEFSPNLIYDREPVISGLGHTILKFSAGWPELSDLQALSAVTALAETYRTLASGIYYEKPPSEFLANALYAALGAFVQDYKKRENERLVTAALKDSEVFYLLVFLARMVRMRTNGRSRARIFLQFLRAQFPQAEAIEPEPSRIIVP
ncbi:MAG TPA: hypothetical protein VGG55_02205 [Candidatus Acidoferrales bacterium]